MDAVLEIENEAKMKLVAKNVKDGDETGGLASANSLRECGFPWRLEVNAVNSVV